MATTPTPVAGDEIQVLGPLDGAHYVVVHSHADAPCSRCGSMDIHTVQSCADDTREQALESASGEGVS